MACAVGFVVPLRRSALALAKTRFSGSATRGVILGAMEAQFGAAAPG